MSETTIKSVNVRQVPAIAWILGGVAVIGGGLIIRKEIRKARTRKRAGLFGSQIYEYTGENWWTGKEEKQTINLATIANAIYDSFFNNDWFGITENEDRAILELSKVPKELIPILADLYYKLYDRVLTEDFNKFCSKDAHLQIIRQKFNQ